jgi:hypothetical protein
VRILLDECVHSGVRAAFPNQPGLWSSSDGTDVKDKEFLGDAERAFDVFVTIDRKIELENDLTRFRLGFVIVRVKSNVTLRGCRSSIDCSMLRRP